MTVTYHDCSLQSLSHSSDQKVLLKVQRNDVTLNSPNVAVLGKENPYKLLHAILPKVGRIISCNMFFSWYGEKYNVEDIY